MSLNKPNQQLRRDLTDAANTLDELAHQIFKEGQQRGEMSFWRARNCAATIYRRLQWVTR